MRCGPLPRESSRANEVTMEQAERCELDAIEGPSLGRLQLQTMLQRASADMLRINDENNGALLAMAIAAVQSQNAMADDCRARGGETHELAARARGAPLAAIGIWATKGHCPSGRPFSFGARP